MPTYVAVSPTPATWDDEQVASFYREYNATLLHDHDPRSHARSVLHRPTRPSPDTTRVRRFGFSGVFVEGWAVEVEEFLLDKVRPRRSRSPHSRSDFSS